MLCHDGRATGPLPHFPPAMIDLRGAVLGPRHFRCPLTLEDEYWSEHANLRQFDTHRGEPIPTQGSIETTELESHNVRRGGGTGGGSASCKTVWRSGLSLMQKFVALSREMDTRGALISRSRFLWAFNAPISSPASQRSRQHRHGHQGTPDAGSRGTTAFPTVAFAPFL